ncbi:hypothetical protein HBI56_030810 [Parastagonospora nodorum]|nr:hypothetical protein HBI80_027710 [Parastagonospora nodorum]KAH4921537.1 hypothetical protein HBH74_125840 [Parastagonospora nodorum]KAH5083518.1 hypothetical protein HBI73_160430 [Parastagonospora nodorum]KAH5084978.1 hypothetical protein HBH95_025660 [Parastagonospora nodorum]KAH5199256.1 hypothetical protein HBH76_019470 [Parastagonospora nodorum]
MGFTSNSRQRNPQRHVWGPKRSEWLEDRGSDQRDLPRGRSVRCLCRRKADFNELQLSDISNCLPAQLGALMGEPGVSPFTRLSDMP